MDEGPDVWYILVGLGRACRGGHPMDAVRGGRCAIVGFAWLQGSLGVAYACSKCFSAMHRLHKEMCPQVRCVARCCSVSNGESQ